jgi:hypothetical protein
MHKELVNYNQRNDNKRFLSLAERYGKLDNIVICQRKEAPNRYRTLKKNRAQI